MRQKSLSQPCACLKVLTRTAVSAGVRYEARTLNASKESDFWVALLLCRIQRQRAPLSTVSSHSVRTSPHRVLCKQGHASLESRKIHSPFFTVKQQNLVSGNWCKIPIYSTFQNLILHLFKALVSMSAVKIFFFFFYNTGTPATFIKFLR